MTIEVVTLPDAFVTVATVWFVNACPACATTLPRRSAAAEVVAKRAERRSRDAREDFVMDRAPVPSR